MPRFGTRALLIAFVVVALWLSTFSGFAAGQDLRRSLLLVLLIAAASMAVYGRGRRRAFWAGFAIVMFLCGGLDIQRPLNRYVPDFAWQWMTGNFQPVPPTAYSAVFAQPVITTSTAPAVVSSGTLSISSYPPPPPMAPAAPTTASIAMRESMVAGWILALAAICGFIVAYVHSRLRPKGTAETA